MLEYIEVAALILFGSLDIAIIIVLLYLALSGYKRK